MKLIVRFLAVWLLSVVAISAQADTVTINSVTINRSSDINFDNGLSVTIDDAAGVPRDAITINSDDDLILWYWYR